jgi:hypothetical protein
MHCTGAYRGCAASPHLIGHVRFSEQRLLRLRLLQAGQRRESHSQRIDGACPVGAALCERTAYSPHGLPVARIT